MSEIVVRPAVLADAPAMARVHVRSWQETYRGYFSDEVLDDPGLIAQRERMWTATLSDEHYASHRIAVAELDGEIVGEIVGIASSGPSQDDDAAASRQLYVLYLLAAHHGSGAAQELFDAVVGHEPTSLWVADPNPRAQAFYRRNGFEPDGVVGPGDRREIRMLRPAH